jgi:hypothetical protein
MTKEDFSNLLRILRSTDAHEVPALGDDWPFFRDNPYGYFIGCSEENQWYIWGTIMHRHLLHKLKVLEKELSEVNKTGILIPQ